MTNFENIPQEMKQYRYWCNFKLSWKAGTPKPSKIPYDGKTGKTAKTNDPNTWCTFDEAVNALRCGNYDGLGFMLAPPFFGVDIDHMDEMGNGQAVLDEFITTLNTYTEYSPSGTGIHCICKGELPPNGNRKGAFEMYQTKLNPQGNYTNGRYFTVTGNVIASYPVADCTESIKKLHQKYIGGSQKVLQKVRQENFDAPSQPLLQTPQTSPPAPVPASAKKPLTDSEVIEKASQCRNGAEFRALYYDGDLSRYNHDRSRADLALCDKLAFWTGKNLVQMDNIFRTSALFRPKWDEFRGDNTYATITLLKAIDSCGEVYTGNNFFHSETQADSPPNLGNKPLKPFLCLELLQEALSLLEVESVSLNLISQKILLKTQNPEHKVLDFLVNDLRAIFGNQGLRGNTVDEVQRLLCQLAFRNRFNPFLNLIQQTPWDQVNRLPEVFAILEIEDELSKILIYKWLKQVVSLQYNTLEQSFSSDGCLVLVGDQGIGKSSFLRHLLSEKYFPQGLFGGEKYLNFKDKDTEIRNNRFLITELSEIESTMRGDIERLKGFLTTPIDQVRVPYGRSDQETPRRTSYCGSCNNTNFLKDTQNRRFWTVPVTTIHLDRLEHLDSLQLWIQILEEVNQKGLQSFRLTKKEQIHLQERNQHHQEILKSEAEIRDILDLDRKENLEKLTVTNLKDRYPTLQRYSVQEIAQVLIKLGFTGRKSNGKLLYPLPLV